MSVTAMTTLAGLALTLANIPGQQNDNKCDLKNDTVEVGFYYPNIFNKVYDAGKFTVPASNIDPRGFGFAHIDLQERTITVRYTASNKFEKAPFHGYLLTDLSRNDIRSVTVDHETTVDGITASRLTVKNNSIALNLTNISYHVGEEIKLSIGLTCDRLLISRSQ